MMTRRLALALPALLAGLAASAAPPSPSPQPPEKPKITIAVGGQSLFYYLPLTLADRLGYFKDEGLDVTIVDFAGGAKALQAMVGGSADLVSGSFEHTMHMQAKGIPVTGVVLQERYASIALGLSKAQAARYKSPKDLKGLKIGVTAPGSSTNFFVNALLAMDKLKPDAVSIIGVGTSANAVAAMKKGEIDGIANLDPIMTKLEREGDVVVVADTRTAEGMKKYYGGDYASSCVYALRPFIDKNPATVQAVVNAMVRAVQFARTAPLDKIVATVPPDYYGSEKENWKAALAKNVEAYSPDGRISPEGARNVYNVLKMFEPSVMSASIEVDKTFDNRFVEAFHKAHPAK
jgi:NitT/TauT family transport system substrate-binding protein